MYTNESFHNRYQVTDEVIGRGGQATVVKAYHRTTGKNVAVKIFTDLKSE